MSGAAGRGVAACLRSAAPAALLVLVACASANPREAGVSEVRETLAERRAATRGVMEEAAAGPSAGDAASDAASGVWDFLGTAGGAALDVLSLRTFGLW